MESTWVPKNQTNKQTEEKVEKKEEKTSKNSTADMAEEAHSSPEFVKRGNLHKPYTDEGSPHLRYNSPEAQKIHSTMFDCWCGRRQISDFKKLILAGVKSSNKPLSRTGKSGHTIMLDLLHLPFGDELAQNFPSTKLEECIDLSVKMMDIITDAFIAQLPQTQLIVADKKKYFSLRKQIKLIFLGSDNANFNPLIQAAKEGDAMLLKGYLKNLQRMVNAKLISSDELKLLFTATLARKQAIFHVVDKFANKKSLYMLLISFIQKNIPEPQKFLKEKILSQKDTSDKVPNVPDSVFKDLYLNSSDFTTTTQPKSEVTNVNTLKESSDPKDEVEEIEEIEDEITFSHESLDLSQLNNPIESVPVIFDADSESDDFNNAYGTSWDEKVVTYPLEKKSDSQKLASQSTPDEGPKLPSNDETDNSITSKYSSKPIAVSPAVKRIIRSSSGLTDSGSQQEQQENVAPKKKKKSKKKKKNITSSSEFNTSHETTPDANALRMRPSSSIDTPAEAAEIIEEKQLSDDKKTKADAFPSKENVAQGRKVTITIYPKFDRSNREENVGETITVTVNDEEIKPKNSQKSKTEAKLQESKKPARFQESKPKGDPSRAQTKVKESKPIIQQLKPPVENIQYDSDPEVPNCCQRMTNYIFSFFSFRQQTKTTQTQSSQISSNPDKFVAEPSNTAMQNKKKV